MIGGGTINVTKSNEGIEGAILEIAGGDISVVANDDGLNVSDGSGTESFGPGGFGGFGQNNSTSGNTADIYVLITGGRIVVDAQGDGIDANGALYVKGGEIYVTGPENNGNGA